MRLSNQVLRRAQQAAKYHSLYVSCHAEQRLGQRGVQIKDMEHSVVTAKTALASGMSAAGVQRWKLVGGVDIDGDSLEVVVELDALERTIVVTLF